MATAYQSSDLTEAHIVCGLLNANGINAHVGGHYLQGGVGELSAINFAEIQVDEHDLARARQIIAEYEHKPEAPVKPVSPGMGWRTRLAVFIVSLLFIMLLAALF